MLVKNLVQDRIPQREALPACLSGQSLQIDRTGRTDTEKINLIEGLFEQIMQTLGLDLKDDSLKGTPRRVAHMYVHELFSGLNAKNKPEITLFENTYAYGEMLIERDISLYSSCEHHFVPIIGKAHVGYIPSKHIIGLSKINRIVHYCSRRPQVQERLTLQIADEMRQALGIEDVAVVIDASHLCVASRGIRDTHSNTRTSFFGGKFKKIEMKNEFLTAIKP